MYRLIAYRVETGDHQELPETFETFDAVLARKQAWEAELGEGWVTCVILPPDWGGEE